MIDVANAKINSLPKTIDVSPNEEAIFVLTSSQLSDLITEAVQKAIQPLQDRVESMEATITALDTKVSALESTQEQDVDRICLDVAYDRQRLAKLESRPSIAPTPTAPPKGEKTIARVAKIDEVLKSRGPTTLKEMERILKISPKEMNRLLAKLDMRRYELHSRPGDDREKVLRLKVQIR